MPFVSLKVAAAPSPELTRRLSATVVSLTARLLKKKRELTAVAVEYVAPENWTVGGETLARRRKASFWLDIKVTDGTNTKDEKAAFVAAVFAAMNDVIGPLHPESYVLVHDVRAEAYGYGGLTQEHRYVAAALAAAPLAVPA